jgi:hypothetical protein
MSEFSYLNDRLAASQINERIATVQRSTLPGQRRRHHGRHALASRLHSLAARLDA